MIYKIINKKLMTRKYIIRRRKNTILYTEFLIAAATTAILVVIYFKLHPAIGIIIGIAAVFLFAVLFFANRFFRYIFSILFSLGWAVGGFWAGQSLDKKTDTTARVFSSIAFAVSIWAHWNHFTFLKEAKMYEYEKR